MKNKIKKTGIAIIFCLLIQTIAGLSANNNSTMVNHCVFMTYSYTMGGQTYQGSGFYCIEWFWRTGQNPTSGQTTNAIFEDQNNRELMEGDVVTFKADQVIEITVDEVTSRFEVKKGDYRVNSKGLIAVTTTCVE